MEYSRIHTRYYDFLFPILIILILHVVESNYRFSKKSKAFLSSGSIVVILLWISRESEVRPLPFDSAFLYGISRSESIHIFFGFIGIIGVLIFLTSHRYALKCLVYIFLPFTLAFSTFQTSSQIVVNGQENIFDSIGKALQNDLALKSKSSITILGDNPQWDYRIIFNVDKPSTRYTAHLTGQDVDLQGLTTKTNFLLVTGHLNVKYMQEYFENPGAILFETKSMKSPRWTIVRKYAF